MFSMCNVRGHALEEHILLVSETRTLYCLQIIMSIGSSVTRCFSNGQDILKISQRDDGKEMLIVYFPLTDNQQPSFVRKAFRP